MLNHSSRHRHQSLRPSCKINPSLWSIRNVCAPKNITIISANLWPLYFFCLLLFVRWFTNNSGKNSIINYTGQRKFCHGLKSIVLPYFRGADSESDAIFWSMGPFSQCCQFRGFSVVNYIFEIILNIFKFFFLILKGNRMGPVSKIIIQIVQTVRELSYFNVTVKFSFGLKNRKTTFRLM